MTETDSNDDVITELEFTEARLGLSKDIAPGPDRVKYSDIKNLSSDNKSELFIMYEESLSTGQVPEDWFHSYLKLMPNPGKTLQAKGIPYPHNAEHHGKADGTDCGQEACSGLRKEKRTSPKPMRIQSRKETPGKAQPDSYTMSMKDCRGRNMAVDLEDVPFNC